MIRQRTVVGKARGSGEGSVLIASATFASSIPSTDGWYSGTQAGGTLVWDSSGAAKGTYPAGATTVNVWLGNTPTSRSLSDVYIEFDAKMPSTYKHGFKFCKIFGQHPGVQYNTVANTTFGMSYSGFNGSMTAVSFGDGTTDSNDTQNIIKLDGTSPSLIGRSYGSATVLTPQSSRWDSANWGTGWHHFKFHCAFNSGTTAGNEVNDGKYYVEIDGVVYVNATGLFNRHYSNLPIDYIEFYGYTQSGDGTSVLEVWYDNIVISTGGFV